MGVEAEEEEVALQKREKKKNKRNKKTEDGFVGMKTVCGEKIVLEGVNNGVELGTSKKKGKKNVEDKKDGGSKEMNFQFTEEGFINDEGHTGAKNEKKSRLELKEKKKCSYDESCTTIEGDNSKKRLNINKNEKDLKNEMLLELMKEKKEKRNKNKEDISPSLAEVLKDKVVGDNKIKGVEHCEREGISDIKERERRDKQKKKKEKKENKFMDKEVRGNKETMGLEHCESDIKEWEESDKQKKKNEKREKKVNIVVEYPCLETSDKLSAKGNSKRKNKENYNGGDSREIFTGKSIGGEGISDIKKRERKDKQKKEKKEKKFMDKEVREYKETMGLEHRERECVSDIKGWEESDKQKKKKETREKKVKECSDVEYPNMETSNKLSAKGKSEKKHKENDNEGDSREIFPRKSIGGGKTLPDHKYVAYNDGHSGSSNKNRDRGEEVFDVETKKKNKKRKRTNSVKDFERKMLDSGEPNTANRGESMTDRSKMSNPKESHKKVKFSGHVEVFPFSNVRDAGKQNQEDNLVRGKRFSQKEDAMIKAAVLKYIKEHGLGENGVDMVMHCKKYSAVRDCWREIGDALPWRPYSAIYARAHNLFERAENGWTEEEKALILKFHKDHGSNWKKLAEVLGKHSVHVKDAYRLIKQPNLKRGPWSQEEYQTLFDLVNMDLRMKAFEEKKSQHGMLRDNISWSAISEKLGTRRHHECCMKWYGQLTSPMVKAGEWDNTDDYRLLDELLMVDACCEEDVDWGNLIEHRSGFVCRKRWRQMLTHIGEHGIKSFPEQLEVLAKRYCPELLETIEASDSRPVDS
ncbi:SANT/Myb domain [Macleaya cordata]|uniref:SANT/Myb domain n=1 Tax=Macleaya cordata TaxID=56857 RepID=A0A200QN99_MACCD|nr:SANT/Myb domain [Macleaya cordata]